jgi:hypothetical protein
MIKHKAHCAVLSLPERLIVPIYNHLHHDKENGQMTPHYHVDFRFISKKHHKNLLKKINTTRIENDPNFLIKICYRKRRMYSKEHLYRTPDTFISNSKLNYKNLEKLKCPHKGYDLSNEKCDSNGWVTCPLHSLKVRIKSNETKLSKQ